MAEIDRALPSGKQPNFGKKNTTKPKKDAKLSDEHPPVLPNGQKPNFGEAKKGKKKDKKDNKKPVLPNGDKPVFKKTPMSNSPSLNGKPKKKEETYAGSSFHSSPAALNLPKPSFKPTSQNQQAPQTPQTTQIIPVAAPQPSMPQSVPSSAGSQPISQITNSGHPVYASPQSHQMIPQIPQYPVTMYPPQQGYIQQPGFAYQYSSNGYIQYQYPTPMGVYQAPREQKISFNDLLGSAK